MVVLQQSEEIYQLLVETKDYAIFKLDPNGYIASWSIGGERLFGYQKTEILGQHGSYLFTSEAIQSRQLEQELTKAVATGWTEAEGWHVRKDGTCLWAASIITAIRDETGTLQGFSKVAHDFTGRKQAEEKLAQLLERQQVVCAEAEVANRRKNEFLAVVSHELRSPLNAILGWAQLLRTRKFDAATTARALETIERNAKLQTQLIENLLDISRISQGKLCLNVRACRAISIVELVINTMRPAAEAKSIQLKSVLDPVTGYFFGDADRLQQIVSSLLSNAIKFTPAGGRVEVQLWDTDSHLELTVSDTGLGISADFLPYIFESFRQANSTTTRSHSGLGLGLAIARQLVELHGGTIDVASQGVGQGATFTVKLPLQ